MPVDGEFVKADRETDKVLWRALEDGGMGGVGVRLVRLAGQDQVVVQTRTRLAGMDLGTCGGNTRLLRVQAGPRRLPVTAVRRRQVVDRSPRRLSGGRHQDDLERDQRVGGGDRPADGPQLLSPERNRQDRRAGKDVAP